MNVGPRALAGIERSFPTAAIANLPTELRSQVKQASDETIAAIERMRRLRRAGNNFRARKLITIMETAEPDLDNWSSEDLDRGARLATLREHFGIAGANICEHRENLWALAHIVRATPAADLQRDAARFGLALRQRLLVRHLWMEADRAQLIAAREVGMPFLCRVPSRTQRDPHGEEFWSLLHFLPAHSEATGRRLIPIAKCERPDFLLFDEAQRRTVGLEHTEAVASETNKNRADSEHWQGILREALPGKNGLLHFVGVPAFPPLRSKQRDAFIQFVAKAIEDATDDENEHRFGLDEGNTVYFEVKPDRPGEGLTFSYMDNHYGWCGDSPERLAADSIVRAATHKLLKKQPNDGQRSILLVYPNDSAPVFDWGKAVALAAPHIAKVPAGLFEEVWVARGTRAWQVMLDVDEGAR